MHVDDVACNLKVLLVLLLVEDDKEEVETGHDRGRNVDVVTQRLCSVVPSSQGVGSRQN